MKLIILVFLALVTRSFANDEDRLEKLKQGLREYQESRSMPFFEETFKQYGETNIFKKTSPSEPDYEYSQPLEASTCSLCYVVANFLLQERRNNVSIDMIALEAAAVCTLVGIESAEICRGLIDRNVPIFVYIADQNHDLKGERICDLILQNSGCGSTSFEWTVKIPEGETVPRKNPSSPESTFNVLLLSDMHFDPNYTPGKARTCDEPVCCQYDQPDGTTDDACGYWSEYINTDTSEALVDETIRKASESDFDYVYVLGDLVGHRIWSTSPESNTQDLKNIFNKLKTTYKDKPIFPILGNHEPSPLNQYPIGDNIPDNLTNNWLYELIGTEFSDWLPDSAREDLMKGGFYTVSPKDGFRIIAINSNVAYTENWWLIHNDTDPWDQLAWFAKTLKDAEDKGEIVHVLSHIPSGKGDLLKAWSREYHKIVERFSNTIAAQFNGHTHKDQFMVYYSSKNTTEAISVALNGASLDCDKSNPNFRLISVDNSNFDLIDSEQWIFNLTEANLNKANAPKWFKLYSFREQYGVKSLAPSEFSELLPRMASNHSLLYDYNILKYRNSDLVHQWGCDNDCKRSALCEIASSLPGDSTQCDWLIQVFNDHI